MEIQRCLAVSKSEITSHGSISKHRVWETDFFLRVYKATKLRIPALARIIRFRGQFLEALAMSRPPTRLRRSATKMVEVLYLVRARGLEPLILAEPDPKSGVSANSTTRATRPACGARGKISSRFCSLTLHAMASSFSFAPCHFLAN